MSEENKEKLTENQNVTGGELANGASVSPDRRKSNRLPVYIALSVIGVVLLGAILIWFFRSREGGAGQLVPAPRTVSFEPNGGNEQSSPTNEEQIITIAAEQVERGGIKIETVGETLSQEAVQTSATGIVQPDAYAETPVISLVGGVVRSVPAQLGENVQKGQTVAVIFSDELSSAQSRYLTLQTEAQVARQTAERSAKLLKINPASRSDLDQAQAKLKSDEAALDEMRRRYNRTVKLVEIGAASREELEQDRTKLKTAEAESEQSRKQFERATEVARLAPASNSDFEQAAVKLRTAESELSAARQKLIVLGLSQQRVDALRFPSQINSELTVAAPVSGTVTARTVNQNEVVEANKELMRVTNLSTVWVIAQIYEKDLGRIRTGSGASVTTDAYPDRVFRGQVTYIDPNINQETRTAQARVELENAGQILKIGQYVNVAFGSLGTAEKTSPVVPTVAVQNINNRQTVFVATDQPNVFAVRFVRLAAEVNGQYIVLEGLNVGDKIVTSGSFLLRAEWLKQHPAAER
jgi:RND family efflux transporter MFP subunit